MIATGWIMWVLFIAGTWYMYCLCLCDFEWWNCMDLEGPIIACCKELSWHLLGQAEENHGPSVRIAKFPGWGCNLWPPECNTGISAVLRQCLLAFFICLVFICECTCFSNPCMPDICLKSYRVNARHFCSRQQCLRRSRTLQDLRSWNQLR
jgi:hypothetical protein